eukprot:625671-Rhodomonas_salina.1
MLIGASSRRKKLSSHRLCLLPRCAVSGIDTACGLGRGWVASGCAEGERYNSLPVRLLLSLSLFSLPLLPLPLFHPAVRPSSRPSSPLSSLPTAVPLSLSISLPSLLNLKQAHTATLRWLFAVKRHEEIKARIAETSAGVRKVLVEGLVDEDAQ